MAKPKKADLDRVTGTGAAQLIQLMGHFGFNEEVGVELATVTAAPPALKIKLDSDNLELEKADLIVAQYLTKHSRKVTITNAGKTNLSGGSVSVTMSPAGEGPHTHAVTAVGHSGANLTVTEATVEYLDELKVGDRVIVLSFNGGQLYAIIDKAVTY